MASLKNGSIAESSSAAFSYAQAAKGRSATTPSSQPSSAVSGAATPSLSSASEFVPGSSWAEDADGSVAAAPSSHRTPDAVETHTKGSEKTPATNGVAAMSADSSMASPDVRTPSVTTSREDDSSSLPNSASETTWDSKSQSSEPASKATESTETKASSASSEASSETAKQQPAPVKKSYQESKPPAVNPWLQRAKAMKKVAPSPPTPASAHAPSAAKKETERAKAEPRKKRSSFVGTHDQEPAVNGSKEYKKGNNASRNRDRDEAGSIQPRQASRSEEVSPNAQRKAAAKESAPNKVAPPPVRNDVSWPEPRDVLEEDKKKAQEAQAEKERAAANASKSAVPKKEWTPMPYVPSAVFETTLPTRGGGGGRGGRGGARGAATQFGARGAHHSATNPTDGPRSTGRAGSLPNGDASTVPASAPVDTNKTDREAMPAPALKNHRASSDANWKASQGLQSDKDATIVEAEEQVRTSAKVDAAASGEQGPPRRNKSPRKPEATANGETGARRSSIANLTEESATLNGAEESPAKSSLADRRADSRTFDTTRDSQSLREGKRGSRRGGANRGIGNAHFSPGHHVSNGFADYPAAPFGMSPQSAGFHPQRGGHYSQQRGGYRNQPMRSQSIPVDNYGRVNGAYSGYPSPMMPQAQGFMQDYYGTYAAGAYPYYPPTERDMLMTALSQQLEYYFSTDNMVKDIYLRKHMDSQGYILMDVIAEFNRIKALNADYDLLRTVCAQSNAIEIRIGEEDGKDRLRKVGDWDRWVLPIGERDATAQNPGPSSVRRLSNVQQRQSEQPTFYPRAPASAGVQGTFAKADRSFQMMNGGPPPFYPNGFEAAPGEFASTEEARGRQVKSHQRDNSASPLAGESVEDLDGEPDRFPSSQIEHLTVVVRKHEPASERVPYHNAGSRTFSDGSIDSRNIMDEVQKVEQNGKQNGLTNGASLANGDHGSPTSPKSDKSVPDAAVTLFWVKDKEVPVDVDSLPADTTHEMYTHLYKKAFNQRNAAATSTCPYDMDVLYQFWSHFLIRNFNSQMYLEFCQYAAADLHQRHNSTGINNLMKYYSESLSSPITIRDRVARDYTELVTNESGKSERPAFKLLRAAWRNGALNIKNRKKMNDLLDSSIKAELEA